MARVYQTNFHGDHNLGLFGKACSRYCLIGSFVLETEKVSKVLGVETIKLSITNTDLVGIFASFNSNGLIVPKILKDRELKIIKRLKKDFDLNILVLKTKFTAIGNLVLCNDNGAVISKVFSKSNKKRIGDCLDVPYDSFSIAGMDNVGSSGLATDSGCLVHRDANDDEIKKIEELLKVEVGIGTANFGSPFVGSGVIANKNGAVVGESSTGPEVNRLMETMGYF